MMKKIYILLTILFTNLFGQTFTGFVKDVSGTEISYVIIEELNSKSEERNWTISDKNGNFSINVMNESSVLFQRIGFKDVIVKPEERLNKSIWFFWNFHELHFGFNKRSITLSRITR